MRERACGTCISAFRCLHSVKLCPVSSTYLKLPWLPFFLYSWLKLHGPLQLSTLVREVSFMQWRQLTQTSITNQSAKGRACELHGLSPSAPPLPDSGSIMEDGQKEYKNLRHRGAPVTTVLSLDMTGLLQKLTGLWLSCTKSSCSNLQEWRSEGLLSPHHYVSSIVSRWWMVVKKELFFFVLVVTGRLTMY